MRVNEVKEYEKLLEKFRANDDLYRLIDLMKVQYDRVQPTQDGFLYMREVLARNEEEGLKNVNS